MKQKVLAIVGPTASGKSALAVELARKFNGEIISADSRQVYRGLNIGTGKITKKEMRGVPHHLLDVASPKKYFSADDFVKKGCVAIADVVRRGKLPIICGGTGFYIDALLGRITLPNVPPNMKLRSQLEKKSATQLFALLKKRDPRRATTIEPEHKRRLIRALEIADALGQNPVPRTENAYDVLWVGIKPTPPRLEKRIKVRLTTRIKQGMLSEAKRLHTHGVSYRRMEELGLEYRSLAQLLQKKVSRNEFEEQLFREIRRYAKKQSMYWKRNSDIKWFSSPAQAPVARSVRVWLKK